MTRWLALSGVALWAGATLVLSEVRWFSRPTLVDRLRPYLPGGTAARQGRPNLLSSDSFRGVIAPLCRTLGERMARLVGISEELGVRLNRIHSPFDITAFRVRQLGWSVAAFGVAGVLALSVRPPALLSLVLLVSGPLLAFLILEQQVALASEAWKKRLVLELPVVAEQLAMLLSAGFSLGAALNRLADRGHGNVARDLARVRRRIRHGLSEVEALREWASVAEVESVNRLVPILALNREASDLGRLISEEARAIRRDVQRQLVETAERRGQQVWIPVTVAALLPGVVFLAIPFIEAMRLFSGS